MLRWWLVSILLLCLFALGLFVRGDPPPGFDRAVGEVVRTKVPGAFSGALEATSNALYPPWDYLFGLALALLAWRVRGWRSGLFVLLTMALVMLAVAGLKPAFGRLRPEASVVAGGERSDRSYVSGHVAWTAATLGAFAVATTRRRRTRLLALLGVGVLTLWTATSRIHLGRHYLSDAVGSVLLAAAVVLALYPSRASGADDGRSGSGVGSSSSADFGASGAVPRSVTGSASQPSSADAK